MNHGGGGTGHGGGHHGDPHGQKENQRGQYGQHGHQQGQTGHRAHHPGQPSHHKHGHLNGGIPANALSESANWAMAMQGKREKVVVTLFKTNKMRLVALSWICAFFVTCLFVIDISHQRDKPKPDGPRSSWNREFNSATSNASPVSVEAAVPSAFGAPRQAYESSSTPQSFGTPNLYQAPGDSYPSAVASGSPQTFAPADFGAQQQTIRHRVHSLERYRTVINR